MRIGTVQFGMSYGIKNKGKHSIISDNSLRDLLHECEILGFYRLDTANDYGISDERIIQLSRKSFLKKLDVCTKISLNFENKKEDEIINELSLELEKISKSYGSNQITRILIHNGDDFLKTENSFFMSILKTISEHLPSAQLGLSVYFFDAKLASKVKYLDVLQFPFSVADRRFERTPFLQNNKIFKQARSIFLQGILLDQQARSQNKFFDRYANYFKAFSKESLRMGLTELEVCLGFVMSKRDVDEIIVGLRSVSQLHQMIEAIEKVEPILEEFKNLPPFFPEDQSLIIPYKWKPNQ